MPFKWGLTSYAQPIQFLLLPWHGPARDKWGLTPLLPLSPSAVATGIPKWDQEEGKLRSQLPSPVVVWDLGYLTFCLPSEKSDCPPPPPQHKHTLMYTHTSAYTSSLLSRLPRKYRMCRACQREYSPLLGLQRGSELKVGELGVSSLLRKSA